MRRWVPAVSADLEQPRSVRTESATARLPALHGWRAEPTADPGRWQWRAALEPAVMLTRPPCLGPPRPRPTLGDMYHKPHAIPIGDAAYGSAGNATEQACAV